MMQEGHKSEVSSVIISIGGLFDLAGFGLIAGQCFVWLKTGVWHPISTATALDTFSISVIHPTQAWVGLQKIIDWIELTILSLPASLTLILIGFLLMLIAEMIESFPRVHFDRRDD
jgi:hypothetical protein